MAEFKQGAERAQSTHRSWSVLAAALVPLLLLTWRFDWLCDDAYITFVYARNLAEGHGLVYNPGEWVEGYSEFLWAVILAGGQVVGLSPLLLSRLLSVAAAVLLAHVTTRAIVARAPGAPAAQHGAALFLGCLPPLGVWATSGLATLPFAAAIATLFHLTWSGSRPAAAWRLGLVGAVAALLRADGAWWVAFTLGPAILAGLRSPRGWRAPLVGAALAAGVFLVHVAWRHATYGDWLPHTARAKVGVSAYAFARGSDYVVHFLLTFPGVLLALVLGLGGARRAWSALVVVAATLAYAPLVGGDFMAFGRFLVPMLPLVAVALAAGLARLEAARGRVLAGGGALLCAVLALTPAYDVHLVPEGARASFSVRHNRGEESRTRSELAQWRNMVYQARDEWRTLGEALALVSEEGDELVYGAVGAIGWYSRLRLLDRNGLITPSVGSLPAQTDPPKSPGHDKTVSPDFFAESRPTYLFVCWLPEGAGTWQEEVRRTEHPILLAYLRAGRLEERSLPPERHPRPGHHLLVVPGR